MSAPHFERGEALSALQTIPPDLPRDEWHKVGRAAIAAGLSVDDLTDWSRPAPNFKSDRDVIAAFKTIKPEGGTGPGTLYAMAKEYGWASAPGGCSVNDQITAGLASMTRKHAEPSQQLDRPKPTAAEVWDRCAPAPADHPYITKKQGAPDGLRVVPAGDPLRIMGESMAGALVVPVVRPDGSLSSLQLIAPPDTADRLKRQDKPGKLNLPGAALEGWFTVGAVVPGAPVYLCEGIGQAWACHKATGQAAAVCFGWGRVRKVADELRRSHPGARLVIVPDAGKETEADQIAAATGAAVARMPTGSAQNTDVNDLASEWGHERLAALLAEAVPPTNVALPLGTVFADELPAEYAPPDELVQGVLTAGAGSMLYGDSNSGKTFFTIDLACAVARGVPWMGRRTEPGLVVYVAAESPQSIRSRLQAYQQHHRCKVPNFAIVQHPLDLFNGDVGTEALIALVKIVELQRGQPVRLIVGDTLARLSAGANENSGEDMGVVVQHFDRIREATGAHFLLIHHSGKNAANGARGWSGIRAAIDTEIEVTDEAKGRCAEITKQRDLPTKGERLGFTLEPVAIGRTKWGDPATTCVVVPADAPGRGITRKLGPVEGAVLEFLRSLPAGTMRSAVVKHFDGQYNRTSVYRAMDKLDGSGMVNIAPASGMIAIADAAR